MNYVNCTLCPRQCGVDRQAGERGFCGAPAEALVAKAMLHKWEEPVLAGSGGSGAISSAAAPWDASIARTERSAALPWAKPWTAGDCGC